ncbi:hypothetical protein PAXINDRAFT_16685 [Paxillus involutus ATCC 200175]|uniref:Uncharacterized protein n=1 Tax=Paxillus involutus ATCC 200175 TaxID=664439 RepID=A0A0C9THP3_PAXIN|nr:hypothetical protein PAXINDRAFT_16685 [Paxillus involutus ATCC 200175]
MPLEGEKNSQQLRGHVDETGTHLKPPGHETKTTTHLTRTLYDEESSGECRRMAMGHRKSEGEEIEVGVREDDMKTLYGVDIGRSRRGEARDEARDDKEGQETRKGKEGRMRELARSATNANDDAPNTPPEPPPPPLPNHPIPPHPERRDVDVDTAKSNKTPARRCADAVHDPGGETDAPDSVPPSVRLEGERNRATSLNVEPDNVETDNNEVNKTKPSRNPVGTTNGDERRPSEPTEPPDEKERERGVDSKVRGDNGDNGDESREVEDERGDQSEDDVCQRDGRTYNTGDAMSSVNRDSKRVEAAPLADDEDGQQQNGKPDVTKHVPGPPTPHPSDTNRPTHLADPPRRRGQLKTQPTNVSKPERMEYAPRRTVESTTTQANQMRRKRCRATGGVSQSHHSRGQRAPRPVRRHRTLSTSPIPPNYHIG